MSTLGGIYMDQKEERKKYCIKEIKQAIHYDTAQMAAGAVIFGAGFLGLMLYRKYYSLFYTEQTSYVFFQVQYFPIIISSGVAFYGILITVNGIKNFKSDMDCFFDQCKYLRKEKKFK